MKFLYFTGIVLFLGLSAQGQKTPITLEEAVMEQFRRLAPENKSGIQFLPKSESYVYYKEKDLWIGEVKGKEKLWLNATDFKKFSGVPENMETIPRFSWTSAEKAFFIYKDKYYHVDFKLKNVTPGSEIIGDGEVSDYHAAAQLLAYNEKNNLFVLSGGEKIQVTQEPEGIVSGQSVSRNEYGIEKGTFWNEDGSLLAFYQKDERNVTQYPLTNYVTEPATVHHIRYPMSGMQSEVIRVGVFEIQSKKVVYVDLHTELNDTYYATNVSWSPDNTLYVVYMNRSTDEMQLIAFDPRTGKKRASLITERDEKWVEPLQPIRFLPNQPNQFLWYSQKDGFHRYYKYDTSGRFIAATSNNFELTDFVGFDAKGEYAFVTGTGNTPTETHAFRIKLSNMTLEQITRIPGVHHISASGSGKFFIDQYSNLQTPNRIDLIQPGGKIAMNLLNAENPLKDKVIGTTEIFNITNEEGIPLYCRIIKPSHFDETKKYPAVVYVYNGPHVQLVTNSFLGGAPLWMHYMAEQGYIIFTVDGRGSAHRGKTFEQSIHRNLGTVELNDQMEGVKWLKSQAFINAGRLGIHGWSYGGFMTTSLMLKHPETFKAGVAGGPVIDWNLYEVMYTERYMDTPEENPEGYKNADLSQYVASLKGKLLMIHGTDDDVVVMQHNMKFLKACIDKGIQADFFAYPGHAHNVRGKDRVHLMKKVIDYLIANI